MSDGLGDRLLMFDNTGGPSLELLRFRQDLAHDPEFEAALREQVGRLAFFQHPAFARIRSVQRLEPDDDLALVSNLTPGKRLSEVLHRAHGPALAASLIRQLAPALAQFHQHQDGVSHGLLSPDRIVVAPDGRLTIVEHVVGPAIDALQLRSPQLSSLGIAVPPAPAGAIPRLDAAADWYQLGLVALAVLLGRPVGGHELPQLEPLLDGFGDSAGATHSIRQWLQRALRTSSDRLETPEDAIEALGGLAREEPRAARRIGSPTPRPEGQPVAEPLTAAAAPRAPVIPPQADASGEPSEAGHTIVPPAPPEVTVAEPEIRWIDGSGDAETIGQFASEESLFEVRTAAEVRQQPVTPRASSEQRPNTASTTPSVRGLSPFEEALARQKLPSEHLGSAVDRPAKPARSAPAAGSTRSRRAVPVLALIVVLQAAAIVWLARAVWTAPRPPMAVAADASGESVNVNSHSAVPAPLQLAAAPDLHWVRVTSPSSEGVLGAKGTGADDGSLRISSPIALKVLSGSQQLGAVPGAAIKLSAGRHEIDLVNVQLGYRSRQSIDVQAGQTVSIHVAPPHGWVTMDAPGEAEVSIDGEPVGRTPLGPLPLAIGEHSITFRLAAGTTYRQRVTVRSEETIRVTGKLR